MPSTSGIDLVMMIEDSIEPMEIVTMKSNALNLLSVLLPEARSMMTRAT